MRWPKHFLSFDNRLIWVRILLAWDRLFLIGFSWPVGTILSARSRLTLLVHFIALLQSNFLTSSIYSLGLCPWAARKWLVSFFTNKKRLITLSCRWFGYWVALLIEFIWKLFNRRISKQILFTIFVAIIFIQTSVVVLIELIKLFIELVLWLLSGHIMSCVHHFICL